MKPGRGTNWFMDDIQNVVVKDYEISGIFGTVTWILLNSSKVYTHTRHHLKLSPKN